MTRIAPPDDNDPQGLGSQAPAPGNDEVAEKVAEENARGYRGAVPDETPNEAYSLQSGPDAPPLHTDDHTRFAQPIAPAPQES